VAGIIEEFEDALVNPMKYLHEALFSRLSKKYLGIKNKVTKSVINPKRVLKAVRPIAIHNYLEEFIATLRRDTIEGELI
jgi:hypothetical protein